MPTTWTEDAQGFDPEFEDVPEKAERRPESTEKLAVVSLVAGIAGFFMPIVGPVTAVVSGHVARGEIRKSKGRLGGDSLAKTGLILGYVWLGLTMLAAGAMFTLASSRSTATIAMPAAVEWNSPFGTMEAHPASAAAEFAGISRLAPIGTHSGSQENWLSPLEVDRIRIAPVAPVAPVPPSPPVMNLPAFRAAATIDPSFHTHQRHSAQEDVEVSCSSSASASSSLFCNASED